MLILELFPLSWRNCLDIALVTICFYYLLRFVRGTRAVAALQGLVLLFFVYVFARATSLFTLSWLLESFFGSLFLVLVILFSDDIRKGLSSISIRSFFKKRQTVSESIISELVNVSNELAKTKTGAIIVIELDVQLGDYVQRGIPIDAKLSADLIHTIFFPNTPLHDGAMIINRDGRIVAAGCVLPLTQMVERQSYGTRHRAAIGVTEVSDAVVIVVSEERGVMSIAHEGHLSKSLTSERMERILTNVLK